MMTHTHTDTHTYTQTLTLQPHFPSRHLECFHAVVPEKLAAVPYLHLVVTVDGEPKYFTL